LRILMVTPRFLPHVGGVERYVHEISARLLQRGVDVSVLTTDPTGHLPSHEKVDGVPITRVRAWPKRRDYYLAPDVFRIISTGDWDLVHVQSYHTFVAPLAMAAARRSHVPYVLTFHAGGHSSRLRRVARGLQWRLLRPLIARAARLVAIAQFEIDVYSKRLRIPRDRFVYIPLGTDFASLRPAESDLKPIRPVIASVGRLEKYKGHQRLIQALPIVLEQRPDISVWIAGSGPYRTRLEQLAKQLGVDGRVEIRSVAERAEMARELSTVALVVLLSDYETQPAAALEAIALGRPVLVLDTTGLSELAKRGLARAIPAKSSARQTAEAILEELREPFIPDGVQFPNWDDCADLHVETYRAILTRDA
jgi:glycogen synthase